ncbi:MAG: DUF3052 domain-containing protein [Polyangiaceae bacterium]|nr:DUF3052 domain-containing protein [Polyangiaceae bacterium]
MAGYSGTPLAKKLGIKPAARVLLVGAPEGFSIEGLPEDASVSAAHKKDVDVAVLFSTERKKLKAAFGAAAAKAKKEASIWVAWPKRASKLPTDLTEDVLREELLPTGYVDTKVCAIDDRWSGLRFVLRVENR